jgi:Raf kinase inhibitor-like YbhB/YbcL family protein
MACSIARLALICVISQTSITAWTVIAGEGARRWMDRNSMLLESNAFAAGEMIPRRFTCEGENLSPPLEWTEAPEGTRSFVVLCSDPDAPSGNWRHWAAYDIPADWTRLREGIGADAKDLKQAINDSGTAGYSGPCPPRGHGRIAIICCSRVNR